MPVKIRLQRHGKKGKPYYWIVAADSRSKRDGKYLEKLGSYNPNVNPPIIELDIDGSVKWLQNGAQPTHTARNILSYKGAMLKHHLLGGVAKGALTLEEAETKLAAWLEEKTSKIDSKISSLEKEEANKKAKELEAEKLVNKARVEAQVAAAEEATAEEAVAEELLLKRLLLKRLLLKKLLLKRLLLKRLLLKKLLLKKLLLKRLLLKRLLLKRLLLKKLLLKSSC
jgi:small subunit ribosomal protein S16